MERDEAPDSSQLFLVRLWADEGGGRGGGDGPVGEGTGYVHGKVQHVLSGRAAPFSDWHSLMESLSKMLPHRATAEQSNDTSNAGETTKQGDNNETGQ